MADLGSCAKTAHFTRIEKVLEFIHQHLFLPLSLEDIAQKSCWSRWQLQRVFTAETGINVAQYIRELKLSRAAEQLLDSPSERVLDIALGFGFNSEVSFSRSFKQFFGCSPRDYRKRGIKTGLRQAITTTLSGQINLDSEPSFTQIRIEHKDEFRLMGHTGKISGLFAKKPDFQQSVPQIWQEFLALKESLSITNAKQAAPLHYGVIDTLSCDPLSIDSDYLTYWAAEPDLLNQQALTLPVPESLLQQHELTSIVIPKQVYAVLPHQGPIQGLKPKLEWLFTHWLPQSGYIGVDGFELEIYSQDYQLDDPNAYMEYWLPIQ